MSKLKYCPLLIGYEICMPVLQGQGEYKKHILNPCLKENCVAYKNGKCKYFKTKVEEIAND